MKTSGWGLTARLVSKHFGALGSNVAEIIVNFDPETATEADRDAVRIKLQGEAQKLAVARREYDKERKDVLDLQAMIATDEKASEVMIARLEAGSIKEEVVTQFCDDLEANKARLATEQLEESNAQEVMDELNKLVDLLSKQLSDFDAHAKKVRQQVNTAQAQKDAQLARQQHQEELAGLRASASGTSSALAAQARRAQKMTDEASAMKIVNDIQQKPLDQSSEIEAIRRSVREGSGPAETTIERLRRLSAAKAEVSAT